MPLGLAAADSRETVMCAFHRELDRLPRLSNRQLVQVAMKLFRKALPGDPRQAKLAAGHLDANRHLIASIANRRIAKEIRYIQPLVLTNEAMFDGWEHDGVPVAGETIRKAITQGTKVEYWDGHTEEIFQTDWYLRPEDLDTGTILPALRNPVELKLDPKRGQTIHHEVEVSGLTLFVPDATGGHKQARR